MGFCNVGRNNEYITPDARIKPVTSSEISAGNLAMPKISAMNIFEPINTNIMASEYFK